VYAKAGGSYLNDGKSSTFFFSLPIVFWWLSTFHNECRKPDFSLSEYLIKLAGGDEKKN